MARGVGNLVAVELAEGVGAVDGMLEGVAETDVDACPREGVILYGGIGRKVETGYLHFAEVHHGP